MCKSRRLIGFAAEQRSRPGARRQSPIVPIKVWKVFEEKVHDPYQMEDEAVTMGAALVQLSLRARFSDLEEITGFQHDDTRLEVSVKRTKTSRRNKSRLPVNFRGPALLTTQLD